MKIVIFGLSVSSSWGNGHAALWRALIRALIKLGHNVVFFERDVQYYAEHRDLLHLPVGGELVLYHDWEDAQPRARIELAEADVGMITSYCPDSEAANRLMQDIDGGLRCFYDLDTPVTLARVDAGDEIDYLSADGLASFDLTLSYTGGSALDALKTQLGARRTFPIYGSVDPDLHYPVSPRPEYSATMSYIGTYAPDRQRGLDRLLVAPANALKDCRFVVAGAQYPQTLSWASNITQLHHLPPPEHPAFYSSSALTLNITREAMAKRGWCPSGRLFEAAACGAPILSDWFDGLDDFFQPTEEILVARSTTDALQALMLDRPVLANIAKRARERVFDEHTSIRRAAEMISAFEETAAGAA